MWLMQRSCLATPWRRYYEVTQNSWTRSAVRGPASGSGKHSGILTRRTRAFFAYLRSMLTDSLKHTAFLPAPAIIRTIEPETAAHDVASVSFCASHSKIKQ